MCGVPELLKNDLLLRALRCQPVERTPVWLMRQAGRYLPEYRKLRRQASDFMDFCRQPSMVAEATLQPLRRFGLDAAIIFSDILTIPDALDCGLEFVAGQGPVIHRPIRCARDVSALPQIDIQARCDYVYRGIELTQQHLASEVPLIGFSGSPWTLACYMIEGAGSRDFMTTRRLLQSDPAAVHALLAYLTRLIIDYLLAQIKAGADVIMLFDSWGGLLGPGDYQDVSLCYMQEIIQAVRSAQLDAAGSTSADSQSVPCIMFSKGAAGHALSDMAASGAEALGLDWSVDLAVASKQVGTRVALQGNLDPACLFAEHAVIRARVAKIISQVASASGFVFNLGHGINKDTPIPAVEALVAAVRELSVQLSRG